MTVAQRGGLLNKILRVRVLGLLGREVEHGTITMVTERFGLEA